VANFFDDNEDLQFYFDRWIPWEELYPVVEFGDEPAFGSVPEAVAFWRDLMSALGEFAAEAVAPHAAALDRGHMGLGADGEVEAPPALAAVEEAARAMELHRLPLPREFGGMNAPLLLYLLNGELLARGDVSVMTHFGFHAGIALAMLVYSVDEGSIEVDTAKRQILGTPYRDAIEEIAAGKTWGSMDITEPQAGSDMAQLRARGEQDADGDWFVSGQKIFITSGHGRWHFVIARTEESTTAMGLDGLSLFLVEAYSEGPDGKRIRDRVTLGRVEEKIGHHGSPTCVVDFDRAPARLIGKRGEGFRLMLLLMNNARISVGFESLGLCEAALRMSREYAAQRPSMGKSIDRHEMIADMLDEMQTDVQAIRALAVACAVNEELAQRLRILRAVAPADLPELAGAEQMIRERTQRSRMYTPLLKYFASEKACELARRAIQIHGGAGYTTEYGAEKLLRDALVLPIYEGTSQIQSLMAMKDNLLWIMRNPAAFASQNAAAVRDSVAAGDPRRRGLARLRRRLYAAERNLMMRIFASKVKATTRQPLSDWKATFADWDPKRDFGPAMLHAERLTKMLADVAITELLVEQAERFPERGELCDRWLERALPRSRALLHEITTTGDRLLAKLRGDGRNVAAPADADAAADNAS
jgi:alkylation response protein AidB-like acyl-CoA dehydrogenase